MLPTTDGVVTLRPFVSGDRPHVLQGRDAEWQRWLGPGGAEPAPTACLVVDGIVVGWVDADATPSWLALGEVNVGYSVFPAYRRKGYAARGVRLLASDLAARGLLRALLVIDVGNVASQHVARAAGAVVVNGRSVPGLPSSIVYALPLHHGATMA